MHTTLGGWVHKDSSWRFFWGGEQGGKLRAAQCCWNCAKTFFSPIRTSNRYLAIARKKRASARHLVTSIQGSLASSSSSFLGPRSNYMNKLGGLKMWGIERRGNFYFFLLFSVFVVHPVRWGVTPENWQFWCATRINFCVHG